jgi:hypothetical protein
LKSGASIPLKDAKMISSALAKELKTAGFPQTMIQRAAGASEVDPPVHFQHLKSC